MPLKLTQWDDACVNPPPGPAGAPEEPDVLADLRKRRKSLLDQLGASVDPRLRDAEVRLHARRRAYRDVTVQAVGTVLGGSGLALLAILVGLVPPDPSTILALAVMIVGLVAAGRALFRRPLLTPAGVALADQIRDLDAVIAALESETGHEQAGEGSSP